ncbi:MULTISPECIES: SGM_5486 family transporter-associated protein [unclassified Streptomyces]|nr:MULTISPECIES: SGM_5486 family transporter-associated protein [unclassified Streptomyces]WSA95695.1 SGM_5486 family transporter-associated protein [Streptomyces sp. NBC_01795]WSB80115.1 SGM_5486 family transporter-associated protein [Streptomyces sp. NBC_01775]WSS11678.1 SGM_5486 family transporter-associated protein [Streptomyces sp. NBC_01186]WSS40391.1 SGM_5486 family transporter-associated protein [Streptomyces sp. NBC_01187]
MPVLEPHPPNPQKKLLMIFGAMIAVTVVIGVIASIAAP